MRRRYKIIILFMLLSLSGIILIQALWITSAIKAEEERFDKAVYSAMNTGVANLIRQDLFYFIDRKIDLPRPVMYSDSVVDHFLPAPASVQVLKIDTTLLKDGSHTIVLMDTGNQRQVITTLNGRRKFTVDWNFELPEDTITDHNVAVQVQSDALFDEEELVITHEQMDQYLEQIELNDLKALEELKERENYLIIGQQADSLEKIIRKRAALRAEKEKMVESKMEEFNEAMQQWAFEYSFDDTRFTSGTELDREVDTVIGRALRNNGLDLAFNVRVTREDPDTTIILTRNAPAVPARHVYKTELFPNDFFRKNLYLVIDFPDRSKQIYRGVALMGFGSFLFTAIILLTFGMTLYHIQRQKKLSDIKSDFINNMTHEFKTPIATINLASDTMRSPKVINSEEQIRYYLDIIRQENKRMNNQVEKVLQMALIENHDFKLDFQKTDIHTIIENTVHVAELAAAEKGGKIVSALRASCSEIPVDEIHFANIINNLLDNALKYTEKAPEIVVETMSRANRVIIRVSDNGVGMSREVQKHIFDKFYRRPSGNIHNVKGFGLGLSYVKAIVDAHGGEIAVSSEPGSGSTFTLSFDC